MTPEEYIQNTLRTETKDFENIRGRILDTALIRLDHASDGIATEAGELKDILKRKKFYGQPLNRQHLVEELGDLLWYVALAMDTIDTTFDEVMTVNIAKLKKRYPDKFDADKALNRDLDAENEVLGK